MEKHGTKGSFCIHGKMCHENFAKKKSFELQEKQQKINTISRNSPKKL